MSVVFPNDILKNKKIEFVTLSPIDGRIAVSALSGKTKSKYILRLYQLTRREDGKLFPTHEIGAFSFYTRKQLNDFVDKLPKMSAIEILMVLNPFSSI